jgi:hypothetical protein
VGREHDFASGFEGGLLQGGVYYRGKGVEDLFLGSKDFFVDLDLVGLSFGLSISDTL